MSAQELKVFDTFDKSYRQYQQTEKSIKTYQDVINKATKGYVDDDDDVSKNTSDDDDVAERYTDGNDVVSKRYLDDFEVMSKPSQGQQNDEKVPVEDEIDMIKKKLKLQQFQAPNPKRYKDDFNIVTKPYSDTFREEMGPPMSGDMLYNRNQAPEIERLEKMLSEIKEKKVDKEFSKDKFTEVLIDNLYSQITFLKQQVVELKENKPREHRITVESDNVTLSTTSGGESSSRDSPILSTEGSYMPPLLPNTRNRIKLSQQYDSDDSEKSEGVEAVLVKAKEKNKFSTNYVTLGKHYNDDDTKKKQLDPESLLDSTNDLFSDAIPLQKEVLLSDEEDVAVHQEVFHAAPANRMNERWQAAVIFMIVMGFTILVCCLVPIVLLPK